MTDSPEIESMETVTGMAPADARAYRRWPWWGKVLAYVLLAAVASFSIWFIDRDAMHVASG